MDNSLPRSSIGVFIGRFQPFHLGHQHAVNMALDKFDTLLVIVGSSNEPRSVRNPFTADERIAMIRECFPGDDRLVIVALQDSDYDIDAWVDQVHALVHDTARDRSGNMRLPRITLVGHDKDSSSYYLDLFRRWDFLDTGHHELMGATSIRTEMFDRPEGREDILLARENGQMDQARFMSQWVLQARLTAMKAIAPVGLAGEKLPEPSRKACEVLIAGPGYEEVAFEAAHAAWTRFQWRHSPYEQQFITGDCVVIHNDCVLMVKRLGWPGKGQWALPGGFVESGEFIKDGALRELKEETGIGLDNQDLKRRIRATEVFDAPWRSSRGRTITHAFMIELDHGPAPSIRNQGDEECESVAWMPLAGLDRSQCFEDHYAIIRNMTGRA